jgi:hypothetical protein
MQTKRLSLIEAVVNTGVGFLISLLTQICIVNPLFGLSLSFGNSLWITIIYTAISIARNYYTRRYFTKLIYGGSK